MATEVGSLNASLTLDMSNFQAGMAEARALAAELASALQHIPAGSTDTGIEESGICRSHMANTCISCDQMFCHISSPHMIL